ncbi:uncharacterized protein LOC109857110 [Pseudomyrmex gracilis]|uniref:uncharacterized protein LOC109857110 n=1 Tax=Pseudomyrmex gracilis TaxID=219809 RepID=UPI0009951251|nr:uncharacterized protein LOC109857110 [Pseudomyrmex gracilis]XP_020288699.1 uncharacterized protein LOC109857110 [Pseudomyrmex gracilis]XP_020288700.1 uncharacterized protein LOC109857110 [Pseudomyrmex gracilis]XP_020288701.1 uncharacterized protein LOC109857110 [Pseudomyrmex gracilis]XP_020288702.1 uncharacterized protein LOC109857110 [Pseudomyrmex gracilis]XP_020288703.1 uncharacterized protein LOC109857110 [Pseudomyrmex gracilis]
MSRKLFTYKMSRTLWIVIFAVSVFVSEVSFASSKTTSISATTSSQPVNTSDSATATTESTSTMRYERNETTPHVGNFSELSKRVSSINETVTSSSENKRNEKKCHLADESKDMLNCNVFDVSLESTINSSQENETDKTNQGITKFNDTYPPKIFPSDKNVKSIDKADDATRRRLESYFYATVPTEVEAASSPTAKNTNDGKDISTVRSSNASNDRNTSLKSDPEIVAQKSSSDEGTSQKKIALTMIITLVIAAAAIYTGMIAWKRYLEYKYTHRQLLNNDLEFDASDFHHYEL